MPQQKQESRESVQHTAQQSLFASFLNKTGAQVVSAENFAKITGMSQSTMNTILKQAEKFGIEVHFVKDRSRRYFMVYGYDDKKQVQDFLKSTSDQLHGKDLLRFLGVNSDKRFGSEDFAKIQNLSDSQLKKIEAEVRKSLEFGVSKLDESKVAVPGSGSGPQQFVEARLYAGSISYDWLMGIINKYSKEEKPKVEKKPKEEKKPEVKEKPKEEKKEEPVQKEKEVTIVETTTKVKVNSAAIAEFHHSSELEVTAVVYGTQKGSNQRRARKVADEFLSDQGTAESPSNVQVILGNSYTVSLADEAASKSLTEKQFREYQMKVKAKEGRNLSQNELIKIRMDVYREVSGKNLAVAMVQLRAVQLGANDLELKGSRGSIKVFDDRPVKVTGKADKATFAAILFVARSTQETILQDGVKTGKGDAAFKKFSEIETRVEALKSKIWNRLEQRHIFGVLTSLPKRKNKRVVGVTKAVYSQEEIKKLQMKYHMAPTEVDGLLGRRTIARGHNYILHKLFSVKRTVKKKTVTVSEDAELKMEGQSIPAKAIVGGVYVTHGMVYSDQATKNLDLMEKKAEVKIKRKSRTELRRRSDKNAKVVLNGLSAGGVTLQDPKEFFEKQLGKSLETESVSITFFSYRRDKKGSVRLTQRGGKSVTMAYSQMKSEREKLIDQRKKAQKKLIEVETKLAKAKGAERRKLQQERRKYHSQIRELSANIALLTMSMTYVASRAYILAREGPNSKMLELLDNNYKDHLGCLTGSRSSGCNSRASRVRTATNRMYVTALQVFLSYEGYLPADSKNIDGHLGRGTLSAIIRYQFDKVKDSVNEFNRGEADLEEVMSQLSGLQDILTGTGLGYDDNLMDTVRPSYKETSVIY